MNEKIAQRFLEKFSIVSIGENNKPIGKWTKYQQEKISSFDLSNKFQNNVVKSIGIITGFEHLEVIDVEIWKKNNTTYTWL